MTIEIKNRFTGEVIQIIDALNLHSADLHGADLSEGEGVFDVGTPDGYRFVLVHYDDSVMIAVGCRWFSIDNATLHWAARDDRAASRAALDYAKKICEIKGWKT